MGYSKLAKQEDNAKSIFDSTRGECTFKDKQINNTLKVKIPQ